jgi:hypothetical protein
MARFRAMAASQEIGLARDESNASPFCQMVR